MSGQVLFKDLLQDFLSGVITLDQLCYLVEKVSIRRSDILKEFLAEVVIEEISHESDSSFYYDF